MNPNVSASKHICETCHSSIFTLRPTATERSHRNSIMHLPFRVEVIDHVGRFRTACVACKTRSTQHHYLVRIHPLTKEEPRFF